MNSLAKRALFPIALMSGLTLPLQAYDLQFDSADRTVAGYGRWDEAWNWGFAGIYGTPDLLDNATIDVSQYVLIDWGTTASAKNLYLNGGATLKILGTFMMAAGGVEYVGYTSTATVDHVRGTSHLFQGKLVVGYNVGSTGWYNLKNQPNPLTASDAKLWPVSEVIGDQGTGNFLHDDGTDHQVLQSLTLGSLPTGKGDYQFLEGNLAVGTDEIIGNFGTGSFYQREDRDRYSNSNRTKHTVAGSLILANRALSRGTFSLQGGTLTAAYEVIGVNGNATFTQDGYSWTPVNTNILQYETVHTVANTLSVAQGAFSISSYTLGEAKLTAGDEVIGGDATSQGTFTQSSGSNTVNGTLTLADSAGSTGTYLMNAGTVGMPLPKLSANVESIGFGGVGSFTQSGGSNNALDHIELGYHAGSNGTYTLGGGTLSAPAEIVGFWGSGAFNQTDGTNTTPWLALAVAAGSSGSYTLGAGAKLNVESISKGSGTSVFNLNGDGLKFTKPSVATIIDVGTFSIGSATGTVGIFTHSSGTQQLKAGTLNVGYDGNGTFTQSISTRTTTGQFIVANRIGSVGNCNLYGGQLSSDRESIGAAGQGSVLQTSGLNTTQFLTLGVSATGKGTYTLRNSANLSATYQAVGVAGIGRFVQTGGTNQVGFDLRLGVDQGSDGTYELSSGTLAVPTEYIGGDGTGTFIQTGGSHAVADSLLIAAVTPGSKGTFELGGGTLTAATESIGGNSTGTFTQTGGIHAVGSLLITAGSHYLLAGGTLNATSITGASGFEFTGGNLSAGSITGNLINNGGILSPGSSPGSTHMLGNYTQSAAGNMLIELGGTAANLFDTVNVDGIATLSGTLDVVFWDGFSPSIGNSFDILSAATLSGTFSTMHLPALASNLVWQIEYRLNPVGPDTLRLTVAVATGLLDFSADSGTITQGQSTNLSVKVASDVTSVSIDQGIGAITPVNGIALIPVSPAVTTTYTVTTTSPAGLQTLTFTVTVHPPPAVTATAIAGVYFRIDFTGIPATTYQVRGSLDLLGFDLNKGNVTTDVLGTGVALIPLVPGQPACFYRIEAIPEP